MTMVYALISTNVHWVLINVTKMAFVIILKGHSNVDVLKVSWDRVSSAEM